MRLIQIEDLEIGMKVGKSIYGENGQLLLGKGIRINLSLLDAIKRAAFGSIYIDDEASEGIEVQDTISEQLRREVVKNIKRFFTSISGDVDAKVVNTFNKEVNEMLKKIIDQIISDRSVVVNLVDLKTFDDYTYQHSVNVCTLATVLGVGMDLNQASLSELAKGALLHDIGKMFVDKEIINKKGALTDEEFAEIQKHPQLGFDFAKNVMGLSGEALIGIMQHHEKCDGQGYPHGRDKEGTHLNAQIIAVADVFDAITSKRVYHEAALPSEAIEYIMGNAGKHFSEEVVQVFVRKVAAYPVGLTVVLSNGAEGIVSKNYEGLTMRPKIKIITKDPAEKLYIDLSEKEYMSVTIVGVKR